MDSMLTRRQFSFVVAALPLLRARQLRAAPTVPVELWGGERRTRSAADTVVVQEDGGTGYAHLREKIAPTQTTMLSTTNTNTTFQVWVAMSRQPDDQWQYLKLGGTWWRARDIGHDASGSQANFLFDRATAGRLAAALHIPMHERHKLDGGLRYSWSLPAKATTDTSIAIPVTLRIVNDGKTAVGFLRDGRFFKFAVSRDGKPVTTKVVDNLGAGTAPAELRVLKPGDTAEVTCRDLRQWAALDQPGNYEIHATFTSSLRRDGVMPTTAAEQANWWDIAPDWRGTIRVA